jgi:hypothetical protein
MKRWRQKQNIKEEFTSVVEEAKVIKGLQSEGVCKYVINVIETSSSIAEVLACGRISTYITISPSLWSAQAPGHTAVRAQETKSLSISYTFLLQRARAENAGMSKVGPPCRCYELLEYLYSMKDEPG